MRSQVVPPSVLRNQRKESGLPLAEDVNVAEPPGQTIALLGWVAMVGAEQATELRVTVMVWLVPLEPQPGDSSSSTRSTPVKVAV